MRAFWTLLLGACAGTFTGLAAGQEHMQHMAGMPSETPQVHQAVAVLVPIGNSGVQGTIYFTQQGDHVNIKGKIVGLKPGEHAMHVHEFGDLTDIEQGMTAGSHYNPTGMPHGHPTDQKRHAGDFGNITADQNGVALLDMNDPVVQLNGPHSIIGRSLVVHANPDKFTQPVGDAGPRVAVGVIGIAQPAEANKK